MNSEIARAVMYTTCINHLCVSASPHSNSGARSTTASVELAVVSSLDQTFSAATQSLRASSVSILDIFQTYSNVASVCSEIYLWR